MASKALTREKAEERFKKKLLPDDYGHSVVIEWTGQHVSRVDGDRDRFRLLCQKCKSNDSPVEVSYSYQAFVNRDGAIPQSQVTMANGHIMAHRPPEVITEDATKIIHVNMKRGGSHEFWVAPASDTDFFEEIDRHPYTHRDFMWSAWKKNTKGQWRSYGSFTTKDEATGVLTKMARGYKLRGYDIEILERTSTGHIPPSATVRTSVRKLINDYKALRVNATPMETKEWLDRIDDAVGQLGLLETLRDEARERYKESMLL